MNPVIATMIKSSGRSWWEARYSDGRVVSEWDTVPGVIKLPYGAIGGGSEWENASKKGMVGLRLLCPNGMCGELEAPEGWKFFQLKAGGVRIGGPKSGHFQTAHVIGVVENEAGDCLCRAWEDAEYSQFETITDVKRMEAAKKKYRVEVIGPGYCPTDFRYRCYSEVHPGRLIEFRDNVRAFKYQNLGMLSLDVQGLRI